METRYVVNGVSKKRIFRDRRRKLAKFLMSGGVVEDHFCLATWILGNTDILKNAISQKKVGCGTTACIAGMCPIVFPRSWIWNILGRPTLKNECQSVTSFASFFGVSFWVASQLCTPSCPVNSVVSEGPFNGKKLRRVTAYEAGEALLSLNNRKLPSWVLT